jgi:NAD(P)H dehydrogenase (quinone)
MRYLVVFAHPRSDSFAAAVKHAVVDTLANARHQVDLLDLNASGFDPVLSAEARGTYFAAGHNLAGIEEQVARLQRAEGLILIYPSWWFGFPAILKGYFDRVFVPGVAFDLGRFALRGKLHNISKFLVVTSFGSPGWYIRLVMRDPNRRILKRGIGALFHPRCKTVLLTLYRMDQVSERRRRRFLERVRHALADL